MSGHLLYEGRSMRYVELSSSFGDAPYYPACSQTMAALSSDEGVTLLHMASNNPSDSFQLSYEEMDALTGAWIAYRADMEAREAQQGRSLHDPDF